MPLKLPQSALIFNNYIDYKGDKVKVTTSPTEDDDLNVLLLAADAYYTISGEPSSTSKYFFKNSFNYVLLDSYTHIAAPKDPKRGAAHISPKDSEKVFPSQVFIEGENPGEQIPFSLYNPNFFVMTVKKRTKLPDLETKIQDALDVLQSEKNSLSSKIMLSFLAHDGNGYSEKVFSIDSKTIAVLDQIFSEGEPQGKLAIPMVKAVTSKDTLEKALTEGRTTQGVPRAKIGDLSRTNKAAGFSFADEGTSEGFAGDLGSSTGRAASQPPPDAERKAAKKTKRTDRSSY